MLFLFNVVHEYPKYMSINTCNRLIPAFLIIMIYLLGGHTQKDLPQVERLKYLAKSWGLIKYYHPVVTSGELNWDSVLLSSIEPVQKASSKEAFNEIILKLLDAAGPLPSAPAVGFCLHDSVTHLSNFDWTSEEVFEKHIQNQLRQLSERAVLFRSRYVSDSVDTRSLGYARFYEDPMETADLSRVEIRLLALFRYWNVIEYFFPYKDLIEKDWDQVLETYIQRFVEADQVEEYYQELLKLSAEIRDGHANIPYHPELRKAFFGQFTVPFTVKLVEDQLIVNSVKSDTLCKMAGIRHGDLITKIEGKPFLDKFTALSPYLPNSNQAFHNLEICRYILDGNTEHLKVEINRNGQALELEIKRYPHATIKTYQHREERIPWQILPGKIGYAHMGKLKVDLLPTFFSDIRQTKGLILDFRHYPDWQIFHPFLSHFYREKKPFTLLQSQCLQKPGTYYWHLSENNLPDIQPSADRYQKPVVLLVNEHTWSFGEYFVMAMQVMNQVVTVGSQTAGVDGNQVGIDMPGGMRMFLSSLGIHYPDGGQAQRAGVRIDHHLEPKISDIKEKKDLLLDFALQLPNR